MTVRTDIFLYTEKYRLYFYMTRNHVSNFIVSSTLKKQVCLYNHLTRIHVLTLNIYCVQWSQNFFKKVWLYNHVTRNHALTLNLIVSNVLTTLKI